MENKNNFLYEFATLKKVNAVLSLMCTFLIIVHGLYDSIWMFCRGKMPLLPATIPLFLMLLVVLHAILCIVSAVVWGKNKKNKNEKFYRKENFKTIIQRASGMLMLLLLVFHVIGMNNHLNNRIFHSIIHPIFFLVVYVHIIISFSKAFITLGIGNAKSIKIINIIICFVCILLFIFSVIGLYSVMYGSWQG